MYLNEQVKLELLYEHPSHHNQNGWSKLFLFQQDQEHHPDFTSIDRRRLKSLEVSIQGQ